jgi:hypothetical protein
MIWLSLIVMVGTIVASLVTLRSDRGDALGIPLIAIGTFVFLYVIQPLQLIVTGSGDLFLTQWQLAKALVVPAIMLAFFMWGWLHRGKQRMSAEAPWNPQGIWTFGFGAACIGLVLYAIFIERSGGVAQSFGEAHGGGMAYQDNTAYLYDGPWLMLSGSVMMMIGGPSSKSKRWKRMAPYFFLSMLLADAILTGGRGPLFAVATTYFVGRSIAQRKRVSFAQAARMLLPLAVGVFVMVGYRSVLYLGPETQENAQAAEPGFNDVAGVSEYDKEHSTASQEFLYHAVVLDTVDQTGKLEYGVNWLEFLFINPIPRVLWPDKQNPPWIGVTWQDISEHTSLTVAPGSAPGIVADLYERFHLLSAIFFFALGLGLRQLFVAARNLSSPLTAVGYVMFYAVSLNMFAQGFGAIFVPLGFSMAPVVIFTWATRNSQRKAKQRQREMILRQAAALNNCSGEAFASSEWN